MKVGLQGISRPSGALAMVAVDQREALRGMLAPFQSEPVSPDCQAGPRGKAPVDRR